MSTRAHFRLGLAGLLVTFVAYGLMRFRLGVDLTDEGAYLAWPLRVHLGEARFAAEIHTLNRPIETYLAFLYDLRPSFSLYEMRLLGWSLRLLAFVVFATFLFRLSHRPLHSLLAAAIPLFFCHIFGLAVPAYNSLASDFFLIALSLWGWTCLAERPTWPAPVAAGLAFFVATLAHPGLLLVAAMWGAHEVFRNRATSSNPARLSRLGGVAAFVGAWLTLIAFGWANGDVERWMVRLPFARGLATSDQGWATLLGRLMLYPFAFSHIGMALGFAGIASLILLGRRRAALSGHSDRQWLAFGLLAGLLVLFRFQPNTLVPGFVLACVLALGGALLQVREGNASVKSIVPLIVLSCAGALVCATLTYQFTLARSWTSGLLALPFAFGAGWMLLAGRPNGRTILDLLLPSALGLLVACSAARHYGDIYRDAAPAELHAEFAIPKLRYILSTPGRTAALNALYAELNAHVAPGDQLLVFDDAPLIYYLFHARPAYGMAWAVRVGQTTKALAALNQEVNAEMLPRYAVRTLVDPVEPNWETAPALRYENYPLNETLLANYERIRTIHPFEIWRLRDRGEKTSPSPARK